MLWLCLCLVPLAFAISFTLGGAMRRASHRFGLIDQAGAEAHKQHRGAVPNTGGVGLFWAVALPMLVAALSAWAVSDVWLASWWPQVAVHLPGLQRMGGPAAALLIAMGVLHVVGLVDDRKALGPYGKLLVQVAVAVMLAWLGDVRVLVFLDDAFPGGMVLSILLSASWIVVITNAMNFLDNMDGLSAGVGAIIAAVYLAATLIGGQWFVAGLAALLLGGLLGFLVHNFPPARLFMGDGGSLVLGLVLAVLAMRTTYVVDPTATPGDVPGHLHLLLMPLVVMAVPLYDFTSVTLLRLMRGQSPFKGDQNHFSHRLVRLGMSRRRAVSLIWLATLATAVSGVMLRNLAPWQAVLVAVQTFAILLMIALVERSVARPGE